jgi:type II secretory ATPase GspE/PulE/Tfp pilus assembly ATPase PilB-like protein
MVDEKAKEQVLFWRQFKLLISSGVPVVRALSTVAESIADEKLKQAIEKIRSDVERGSSLADAMRFHGDVFSEIAVTLVAVGEEAGTLEFQAQQIANELEEGLIPVGGAKPVEVAIEKVEPAESPKAKGFVDSMIIDAVKQGASDIHIEPFARDIMIRYRVDGALREVEKPPKDIQWAITSRIKMMADMDLSQKRFPQDGKISRTIESMGNREIEMRVSCVPSQWGEAVTIRIFDVQAMESISISNLDFSPTDLKLFESFIQKPNGIIIVSGPTGSGKLTTLYAALKKLSSTELKVITIEDPVEYQINRITQIDVNPELGLTFPVGIRHIMRQDPDIVMVSEVRDYETAGMIIHTALTGHLVFTTLHANDAPGVITRLIDMGVEPFLLGSSLILVTAQRLVRKLCPNCKEPIELSDATLELLTKNNVDISDKSKLTLFKSVGCPECRQTGMRGRIGIFELMPIDDDIRELMFRGITSGKIREVARKKGMRSMREDGMQKVASGITTIDEVLRVTAV